MKRVNLKTAEKMYVQGKPVYIKEGYLLYRQLPPSWEYSSHAPSDVLFYRSLEQSHVDKETVQLFIEGE